MIRVTQVCSLFLYALAVVMGLSITQSVYAFDIPKTQGFVTDLAQVFTDPTAKQNLENTLQSVRDTKQIEIAVLIVPTTGNSDIDSAALEVFRSWGIGDSRSNRGVLLMVANDDKRARIEVGYGIEGDLTDAESGRILRDIIFPQFSQGNFEQGVVAGVDAIALSVDPGEQLPQKNSSPLSDGLVQVVLFGLFIGFQVFIALFAHSKSWWQGGVFGIVGGGLVGLFGSGSWYWALGGAMGAGLVFLGLDYGLSKAYAKGLFKGTKGGPWGGGGGWGGGFGGGSGGRWGGGGFGGFGGGSSGGGGASGGWR